MAHIRQKTNYTLIKNYKQTLAKKVKKIYNNKLNVLKLIAHNKINKCFWKIDRSEILFHSNFFDYLDFGRNLKNLKVADVTITETENWVELCFTVSKHWKH